jgi:uncharacterized protein (DUF1778 family)
VSCLPTIVDRFDQTSAAAFRLLSDFGKLPMQIELAHQRHLDLCALLTYISCIKENAMTSKTTSRKERVTRDDRLGFRLDEQTKGLIERAAQLERRKVSDYCLTAIADAARRTIAEHETLNLSERDRAAFFEAMIHPPEPNERLARALAEHSRRVGA